MELHEVIYEVTMIHGEVIHEVILWRLWMIHGEVIYEVIYEVILWMLHLLHHKTTCCNVDMVQSKHVPSLVVQMKICMAQR